MERQIGNKTFNFETVLRTTLKIKQKFKKPYNTVIENIDKLEADELAWLLYCGIDKSEISEQDFTNYLLDNIGMDELIDDVMWFVKQIQYPGLTEEEIEKKLQEKRQLAVQLNEDSTLLKK